jgi:ribosomal subunit interface protein
MELDIRGLHVPLVDPVAAHARHRLDLSLSRFSPRIRHVDVRLDDVNGPRGGIDKTCHVTIELVHGGVVRTHAKAETLGAAVDLAAHRAARRLARRFDRQWVRRPDARVA